MGKFKNIKLETINFVKKILIRIANFLQRYKDVINIILTCFLVFVTVLLIIVTAQSISVSKSIANIEILLSAGREKQSSLAKITLAKDLLNEVKWNKEELEIIMYNFAGYKDNNTYRPDFLRTTNIMNAIETTEFGSRNIRDKFENYLTIINLVKEDLGDIKIYYQAGHKTKIERIDHMLTHSISLLKGKFENVNIDELINDIENYIQEEQNYYNELDSQYKQKLEHLIK